MTKPVFVVKQPENNSVIGLGVIMSTALSCHFKMKLGPQPKQQPCCLKNPPDHSEIHQIWSLSWVNGVIITTRSFPNHSVAKMIFRAWPPVCVGCTIYWDSPMVPMKFWAGLGTTGPAWILKSLSTNILKFSTKSGRWVDRTPTTSLPVSATQQRYKPSHPAPRWAGPSGTNDEI